MSSTSSVTTSSLHAGFDIRELKEIAEGKLPPIDIYPLLLAIEDSPKCAK